jgi:hypothetical protein
MKILTTIITLITFLNLSAQQENSLQSSLNKALKKDKTITTLQANIQINKNLTQIKWEESPSTQTKQYIIERSLDNLNWEQISIIDCSPQKNQTIEYFYTDYTPIENVSYYRIKDKTKNDEEFISNTVPVNYIITNKVTAGMNLHPDFSEGQKIINIAFEEVFEKEILIVIRDKNGNEYYSKVMFNIEDEKLVAVPIEKEIPEGDYLITATSENQIYSQNIVIR